MTRSIFLPVAALVGAALIAPISIAAASSRLRVDTRGTASIEERYGVVRYDPGARRWAVLSTPTFQSSGLSGASCSSSSGILTVSFSPLASIGTFTVDEDEAYAGRYAAGAVVTPHSMAITFHKAATGAVVKCNAAALRIANSSLQLWVRGAVATQLPPATTPSTTRPTTPPTPPTPPTTQVTTTQSPPPIVDGTDPADSAPPPTFG